MRQKNTDVPSGAAIADRSASPGPRSRGSTGASSRSARRAERDRVRALDRDRRHARAGTGRVLVVDEDPGRAVAPQLDGLRAVLAGVPEAHRDQQPLDARRGLRRDRELGERVAAQGRHRGQRRHLRRLLEHEQRAHRVDRHARRVGLAEDVVEDLERERSLVAGGEDVAEEAGEVEAALPREAAVVPAPLQDVHDEMRRVRDLEEEDLLARDVADPGGVGAAREDVERVEAGAEVGMVAGLDDPPGVVVVAHVAPPRERLVRDPDAVRGGALGELAQLRRRQRVVVDRVLGDVGADQHRVGAELLHDRELRLRPRQVRLEALRRHRLEVAQRLVQRDLEPQLLAAPPPPPRARPGPRSGRARTARPRRSPRRRRPRACHRACH